MLLLLLPMPRLLCDGGFRFAHRSCVCCRSSLFLLSLLPALYAYLPVSHSAALLPSLCLLASVCMFAFQSLFLSFPFSLPCPLLDGSTGCLSVCMSSIVQEDVSPALQGRDFLAFLCESLNPPRSKFLTLNLNLKFKHWTDSSAHFS